MPEEDSLHANQPDIDPDADSGEPLAGSGFEDEPPDPDYEDGSTEGEAQ